MLTVKGYGRYKKVWVMPTFEDEDCGVFRVTSDHTDLCFMQVTDLEFKNLRSQFVTSSLDQWGGPRYRPMAFTEQGVAMLSSVLRSKRAVYVNIEIMRAYVRLREILSTHKELRGKSEELEERIVEHDEQIQSIFEAIRQLMAPPEKETKRIGCQWNDDKP